jgi:hypothetical protein
MSPINTIPAAQTGPAVADTISATLPLPSSQPSPNSQPRHPIRREGAVVFEFLTVAEQALEDAMNRSSSPPPEPLLGKRPRESESGDGNSDTEPDGEGDEQGALTVPQLPSISNVTTATLRYASKKKLRPEQRVEVEAFLLVSFFINPCNI